MKSAGVYANPNDLDKIAEYSKQIKNIEKELETLKKRNKIILNIYFGGIKK